jgi:hypothetical protein
MTTNEQIIMFDPDPHYKTVIDLILSTWDMELAGFAHDLNTSKELVAKIENKELKPIIAIVEAHMGKSEFDGKKIADKLREINPKIKILGYSTYETAEWADFEAIKSLRDTNKTVVDGITKFLKREYSLSNVTDENKPKESRI